MIAVVLVGGFGTRLQPLTLNRPKQMLPVVDRPMLEHVLAGLALHGVTDAVLSLGYRPEMFLERYPDGVCAGVRLTYAVEPEPLDTGGAIAFAARSAGVDETFVAVNGDVLTDIDLGDLLDLHRSSRGEATIALTRVDDPSRYGVVPIDSSGRVTGFIEKPPAGEAPTNWINAGTYVFEPSILGRIPAGRRVSIERETFPSVAADGDLYAVQSAAYWIDAGTPETYLRAQLDLIDGVRGGEWPAFGERVEVASDAEVVGAVVRDGTTVGSGSTVERSVVGAGGCVGAGVRVVDSIIGAGVSIGDDATIESLSVVGDGVEVPPGTHLVNASLSRQ